MYYKKGLNTAMCCILLCGIIFSTTGCGASGNGQPPAQTAPELPIVSINAASIDLAKSYSSALEGVANVEIRPQVSGYLTKILADEGAYVHAGQTLFIIDQRTYTEQLNTATGNLHAAEANLESAKLDVDRQIPLVENKVASDITLRTAQARYNAAKAAVEQAAAGVQNAKISLDYCTVKAPVSGYLGRINYRLGSLIGPTITSPLTLLSDTHEIYAYFSMAEQDFIAFQNRYAGATMGDKLQHVPPVDLELADGSIYPVKGHIGTVEGQFDRNTGSITLRATFPNEKGFLRSGNTAKIKLTQPVSNALLVPIASTIEVQEKIYVFRIGAGDTVRQTPIQVDGKSGKDYIVQTGIKQGDRIVAQGFDRLQDGMVIKPVAAK